MSVGSLTVGGTAITTWARHSRLLKYGSGGKRGRNFLVPYREGRLPTAVKWFSESELFLEVALLRTPNTTLEYLSGLLEALHDPTGLVTLAGSSTFHGSVQTEVELLSEPQLAGYGDPSVYIFQLGCPSGVWEDASASSDGPSNPPAATTVDGDRPVGDATLTFAGPGYLEHTDSAGIVSRVTIDAGAGAGTYVVDCGARTVQKSSVDQDRYLTVTQPWWMRLEAGATASFTSDVNVTVSWRDKWAI